MKAFVEHLSGIVRVGEHTAKYGDPWEYAVTYSSVDGKTAVIKALKSDGNFTIIHAKTIISTIRALGFSDITWVR